MINYTSQSQLQIEGFESPFTKRMNPNNRWVKLSKLIKVGKTKSAFLASNYFEGYDQKIKVGHFLNIYRNAYIQSIE